MLRHKSSTSRHRARALVPGLLGIAAPIACVRGTSMKVSVRLQISEVFQSFQASALSLGYQ